MKTKIKKILVCGAALAIAGRITGEAQTSDTSDIDQLKAQMEGMRTNMDAMQEKINELEQEKMAAQISTNGQQTSANLQQSPVFPFGENLIGVPYIGPPSPIQDRGDLNDEQVSAPRPDGQTLNPKYRGYFPIPNTDAIICLNANPRLDLMADNRNSGNPNRFVTATIPTAPPAQGQGAQFNVTAQASQVSVDVRAPDLPGNLRFFYQNDFFGSGGGVMPYRLKQLYGQFYNVTAGFTFSIFEDPDVWPDTVDYEGPNSLIFARQATVRYQLPLSDEWYLNFGLQQPNTGVDNSDNDATPVNHAPDGGANIRWENEKWGHVQFATIFRCLGADSVTNGNQKVFGWGLNLSTSLNTFGKDTMQGQFTYGQGIFTFCNDNFTYPGFNGGDVAYNDGGQLQSITYLAPMLGYTHYWSEKFSSTATSGYVEMLNTEGQGPAAYHQTYYGSVNLVWQVRKRLSVGMEALYGYKQDKNGANGDVWRWQVGLVYSLF